VSGNEEETAPRTDENGGRSEDITSTGDNNIGELPTSSRTHGHDKPSVSSGNTNAIVDVINTSKARKRKSEVVGTIQPPTVVRPQRSTVPVDRLTVGRSTESNRQAHMTTALAVAVESGECLRCWLLTRYEMKAQRNQ
jgi:hypothetical protein